MIAGSGYPRGGANYRAALAARGREIAEAKEILAEPVAKRAAGLPQNRRRCVGYNLNRRCPLHPGCGCIFPEP